MKLDSQVNTLLTAMAAAGAPAVEKLSVEEARRIVESGYAMMNTTVRELYSVENVFMKGSGGEIPVRIYRPSGEKELPVLLFFHGGGWVLFHLDAYDSICSNLCADTGCIVVSIDYRLSPEYKFPAALDDCLDAFHWVVSEAANFDWDPSRIIVSGDSAGGNLAATVSLRVRNEEGPPILGQLLIYPATTYVDPPTPSMTKFSTGYSLTYGALKWFWDLYLDDPTDASNPYASPLKADDLSNLPDAFLLLSGYDPLFDEGLQYADRLREAGCKVQLSRYDDMIHGFLSYLGYIDRAKPAMAEISTWLKKQFGIL